MQRLLSPQQWAQQANDNYPKTRGTFAIQDQDVIELHWNQDRYKKTIKWDKTTNTAFLQSAPGYRKFFQFSKQLKSSLCAQKQSCCECSHVCNSASAFKDDYVLEQSINFDQDEQSNLHTIEHENNQDSIIEADTPQGELMRWHYRLGHLSFKKIKVLCALGILPRKLLKVQPPKCSACIYGAMTKVPWRTKGQQSSINTAINCTESGQCVSIDQLESTTPGFIAQLKGRLTKDRYHAATIFVDHFSRSSYIYLQRSTSSNETYLAKSAFEAYAAKHGIKIRHYHF